MELTRLIDALSSPSAYPYRVERVDVRQTHISVVFLADPFVYKIKKPVRMGFLDFSTLEQRRRMCEEEVRLNRRISPDVYLGVVPIDFDGSQVRIEGSGEVVEWAVKMELLPEEATLRSRLYAGSLGPELFQSLAGRLAAFHARAETNDHISSFGRFEVVARNARENFEESASAVGASVCSAVFERLRRLTEKSLGRLRTLIEARAESGVPRDTHGDLRLDHVYLFPNREPPADLVVVDCIEFNERFRYADPMADAAFLAMDLKFHGRRDLALAFTDAYLTAANDGSGGILLPFYTAYRAVVRAKVEGIQLQEQEIPESDRQDALSRSQAYWLLALGELESPSRRPCLVMVGGLPGAGKSTLARRLAEDQGFQLVRSDLARKELAGVATDQSARSAFGEGIYSSEWTDRTYTECLDRAKQLLLNGGRVVVDASFREERWRRAFLDSARRLATPALLMICRADSEVVRRRLEQRRGDASDADWTIHQQAADHWEEAAPATHSVLHVINTDTRIEESHERAVEVLREAFLFEKRHKT